MTPNVANDNAPDAMRLQAMFAQRHGATQWEQVLALTRACVVASRPRIVAPPTARASARPRRPSPLTRARMCA